MNNIVVSYSDILSVEFYSSKNGYSAAHVAMKTPDDNVVFVRYEWESKNVNDIPTEVVDFLVNNALKLESFLNIT